MTKPLTKSQLGDAQKEEKLRKVDILLATTRWNLVRIADEVKIGSETVRKYAAKAKIVRPRAPPRSRKTPRVEEAKVPKIWHAPKVVDGGLRRCARPERVKMKKIIADEGAERRAREQKMCAKIVDLYFNHGVEADHLADRFSLTRGRIFAIVGKAQKAKQAGPSLANQ